jgi:methylated-DNA-[protein]-cysteine S-methyltransferase
VESFILNVESPVGTWGVEGTAVSITRIYMPNERWRTSRGSPPVAVANAAKQLSEYFEGTRRHFEVRRSETPATAFQRDVWDALEKIPFGQVRTYAQVASAVKRPRASRAVGNANHANPWPVLVPCHRVVAANGLGGYGGGDDVKRYLLELEGVALR